MTADGRHFWMTLPTLEVGAADTFLDHPGSQAPQSNKKPDAWSFH
jgi:hypothetical protein